jgi:CheY-like chemotaxis protein
VDGGRRGYAFLRAARAAGHAHVPALAIGGFASKQDREEAAAAGVGDHLAEAVNRDPSSPVCATW